MIIGNACSDKPKPHEAALVGSAQNGNQHAFGELVGIFHLRLTRLLFGIVGNEEDARDLAQQSWLKAWQKLSSFRGKSRFSTWLFRIATFTAYDFLRHQRSRGNHAQFETLTSGSIAYPGVSPANSPNPATDLEIQELQQRFEMAIRALPVKQRTAFHLREIEGLSYAEIAEIMNCRQGTVMSRLYHARVRMQNLMNENQLIV